MSTFNGFIWYSGISGSYVTTTWDWGGTYLLFFQQNSSNPPSYSANGFCTVWRGTQDPVTGNDRQAITPIGLAQDEFGGVTAFGQRVFMGRLNTTQTYSPVWFDGTPIISLPLTQAMKIASLTSGHVVDYDTITGTKPYFGFYPVTSDTFTGMGFNFKAVDESSYKALIWEKIEDNTKWRITAQSYVSTSTDPLAPTRATSSFIKKISTSIIGDNLINSKGIMGITNSSDFYGREVLQDFYFS